MSSSASASSLARLHRLSDPQTLVELGVLVVANLVATGVRFLLMRIWVFRATHAPAHPATPASTPASAVA